MNLAEIVDAIEDELQYAPDLVRYDRSIRKRVNEAYRDLITMRRWPWLVRERLIRAYPDFTVDIGDITLTESRRRRLVINEVHFQDAMYPAADTGAYTDLLDGLHGAEVSLDADKRDLGDGNWEEQPFLIDRVISENYPTIALWLDPRAELLSIEDDEGSVNFRFPRIRLPIDCADLFDVQRERDGMRLTHMEPDAFRYQSASRGSARSPERWTNDSGHDASYDRLWAEGSGFLANTGKPVSYDRFAQKNMNVRNVITAAASAGVGLTVGTRYRFRVSWMYGGRFGPPSNEAEVQISSGANAQITVGNLPQLDTSAAAPPAHDYGWRVAVWVARDNGAFYLEDILDDLTPAGGSSYVYSGFDFPRRPWKRLRLDEVPDVYRYFRVWPRPTEMEILRVRYHARPPGLLDDDDTPWFDEQYHSYLVYETCARMASAHQGEPFYIRCKREAKQKLQQIMARAMPKAQGRVQKGMVGVTEEAPVIPPVDWQGDS